MLYYDPRTSTAKLKNIEPRIDHEECNVIEQVSLTKCTQTPQWLVGHEIHKQLDKQRVTDTKLITDWVFRRPLDDPVGPM